MNNPKDIPTSEVNQCTIQKKAGTSSNSRLMLNLYKRERIMSCCTYPNMTSNLTKTKRKKHKENMGM